MAANSHLYPASRAALLGIDPLSIEYHWFPIRDRALPDSIDIVYRVLGVLHDQQRRSRICAVHCRGGIGRTGLVIGCWLVDSGVVGSGDEALGTISGVEDGGEVCSVPSQP